MSTLKPTHPLVGTWITEDEDSDAAFVVKVLRGRFVVSGFCRSDGEPLAIKDTRWDGRNLSFEALVRSTGWKTRNVLRLRSDGKAELQFTLWEVWKKKDVKPGQRPEAWGPTSQFAHRRRYRRAKPNRFAREMSGGAVAVVLEPEVAAVFKSSDAVNTLLRSVIAAMPESKH
jgi:hypothetical protein